MQCVPRRILGYGRSTGTACPHRYTVAVVWRIMWSYISQHVVTPSALAVRRVFTVRDRVISSAPSIECLRHCLMVSNVDTVISKVRCDLNWGYGIFCRPCRLAKEELRPIGSAGEIGIEEKRGWRWCRLSRIIAFARNSSTFLQKMMKKCDLIRMIVLRFVFW